MCVTQSLWSQKQTWNQSISQSHVPSDVMLMIPYQRSSSQYFSSYSHLRPSLTSCRTFPLWHGSDRGSYYKRLDTYINWEICRLSPMIDWVAKVCLPYALSYIQWTCQRLSDRSSFSETYSASEMQPRWYGWRFEEAHRCADRYWFVKDSAQEMVSHIRIIIKRHRRLILWRSLAVITRYTIYKDHITLGDYEIHDGMSLEMY